MSADTLLVVQVATLLVGIAVCTGGGLLALVADTDRPAICVPIYTVAGIVFLAGLGVLCWFQQIGTLLAERMAG